MTDIEVKFTKKIMNTAEEMKENGEYIKELECPNCGRQGKLFLGREISGLYICRCGHGVKFAIFK